MATTLSRCSEDDETRDRLVHRRINQIVDASNAGTLPTGNELHTTVFDDFTVSGLAVKLGATGPTLKAFRGNVDMNAFAGTGGTTEEAFFTIHLLHGLKQGTSPTFHVHWGHIIAVPSGDVKWLVDYTAARGYSVGTYPAPTTLSTTQTAGAQYVHHITNDDDMVVTNSAEIEPDSVLLGRIYRDPGDAADTFENDAYLFQIDMHYQRSHIGTTERNRAWTSTGY